MAFTLPNTITPGTPENATQVQQNDAALRDEFNATTKTATLDTSQIATGTFAADFLADAAKLGISGASSTRRGAVNIPGSESRTNVAYGTLTTPDQVSGIVLPANGLIAVLYQATWQESVSGAGRATIFLGSNQAQFGYGTNTNGQAAATGSATAARDQALLSSYFGLCSTRSVANYTGDVTTGQIVAEGGDFGWCPEGTTPISNAIASTNFVPAGGPCYIFAAAGTYTVSVQFKASSGSVTAKNRKLWVWTIGF